MKEQQTIPAQYDDQYGCNVYPGDKIMVTDVNNDTVECTAIGWRRIVNTEEPIEIKTDIPSTFGMWCVPLERVSIIISPREKQMLKRIDALERIIYDCVRLVDIMRGIPGVDNGESIYNEINQKHDAAELARQARREE